MNATKNAMALAAKDAPCDLFLVDAITKLDVPGEVRGLVHGLSLIHIFTEDMTLTAEWKKLPSALVRIEIDANGGVGGSGSQTVQEGKTVTLEAPTKEGHLFTGWKDEKGLSLIHI